MDELFPDGSPGDGATVIYPTLEPDELAWCVLNKDKVVTTLAVMATDPDDPDRYGFESAAVSLADIPPESFGALTEWFTQLDDVVPDENGITVIPVLAWASFDGCTTAYEAELLLVGPEEAASN